MKTTGRFETREELEAWIWYLWKDTPTNQADIARRCRVSQATVASILKNKPPPLTDVKQ